MDKIILYLEDDANMRRHTTNLLKDKHFNVEGFNRIDQAKEYLEHNIANIECVITDLNMNDEWLDEYQTETDGGMLSGWVWLQRFVFVIAPDIPTIIYSGYIPYLEEYLQKNNQLYLLRKNNIKCVNKDSDEKSGFEGLKKALDMVLKGETIKQ